MHFKKVVQPFLPQRLESIFFRENFLNGIFKMVFAGRQRFFSKNADFSNCENLCYTIQSLLSYCKIFQFLERLVEG